MKGFVAGPCYGAGRLPVGTVDLVDSLELVFGKLMTVWLMQNGQVSLPFGCLVLLQWHPKPDTAMGQGT